MLEFREDTEEVFFDALTINLDPSMANFKQRRKERRDNKFKNSKWSVNVTRVLASGKRKDSNAPANDDDE